MKITCDVIKDLLPLYAEGLASADTAALVEAHLPDCESCQLALQELRAPVPASADTDAAPLKRIQSALKKRRGWTILCSALVSLVLAISLFAWLTMPLYFPYADDVVSVTARESNLVSLRFGPRVSGYSFFSEQTETGDGIVCHVTAWGSVWDRIFGSQIHGDIVVNPEGEAVTAVYYYQADELEDVPIYGEDIYHVVTLPRLFLAYYIVLAAALAVVCAALALLLRRHQRARRICWRVALAPLSYLIAHICVKGFVTMTYAPARDLFLIVLTAVPVYAALFIVSNRIAKRRAKKRTDQ